MIIVIFKWCTLFIFLSEFFMNSMVEATLDLVQLAARYLNTLKIDTKTNICNCIQ